MGIISLVFYYLFEDRLEMEQILLKLFGADPRTACDKHLTKDWSSGDIFHWVCSYGVLVYSRDALARLYQRQGLGLSDLDLDKSVIQWTSSTYNPIQIESDGQDFKNFLLRWAKLSVSKRDELFVEYRRQVAHYLLGIPVDKEPSPVEKKEIEGLVERMIFVPSGTDVPALMRLYFPGECMSILMTDEQGSGTAASAEEGKVPSFGKISDNIPDIEACLVQYRNKKMIPLGDSMVAEIGQSFNEMLHTDGPTLSMLAIPPKTGICPAGIYEMLEKIGNLPVDDGNNIVLVDMAQCRPLTNKRLDQKLKQWLVTGRFDFLFTPSKFPGVPPFVGVLVLSEKGYDLLSRQDFSGDQKLKEYIKRGDLPSRLAKSISLDDIEQFDDTLAAKMNFASRNGTFEKPVDQESEMELVNFIKNELRILSFDKWSCQIENGCVISPSILTLRLTYGEKLPDKVFGEAFKKFMACPCLADVDDKDLKRALTRVFLMSNHVADKDGNIVLRLSISGEQIKFYKKHSHVMENAVNDLAAKFHYFLETEGKDIIGGRCS